MGLERQSESPAAVKRSAPLPLETAAGVLEQTQEYLQREFSGVLRMAAHRIDPQVALETYGIDSILAMDLTRALEKRFGTLSKTLLFEYRTLEELAKYFVQAHGETLRRLFARVGEREPAEVIAPPVSRDLVASSSRRSGTGASGARGTSGG